MSEELKKYVAEAGLNFDELTNAEKRISKRDFEELKIKREFSALLVTEEALAIHSTTSFEELLLSVKSLICWERLIPKSD